MEKTILSEKESVLGLKFKVLPVAIILVIVAFFDTGVQADQEDTNKVANKLPLRQFALFDPFALKTVRAIVVENEEEKRSASDNPKLVLLLSDLRMRSAIRVPYRPPLRSPFRPPCVCP